MARAPFQTLIIPHKLTDDGIRYAVFLRSDGNFWQWIAGGGEDDETPLDAARREAFEEAGIPRDAELLKLDSCNTVPVVGVIGHFMWGPDVLVVPEHCFGVRVDGFEIRLSHEHTEYRWVDYEEALALLEFDSNKNALWELNHRLAECLPGGRR